MADASAVMPYDYTRLLIAAVLGWLAFGELPTIHTWIGAAIIVTSAVYIAHREARLRQTAATHAALSVPAKMMGAQPRSEEHTSELQSLMRISYAVFCLKKKKHIKKEDNNTRQTKSTNKKKKNNTQR